MPCPSPRRKAPLLAVIFALAAAASSGTEETNAASSPWVQGHKAQSRLIAGGTRADGAPLAFIEIALAPGWKTYWRTPGDAGGLPPAFDWSKSANLAAAEVMFPAPRRFTDKSGHTIGYAGGVVLPVALTPKVPGAPIALALRLEYGICKEVCVPVEAEMALEVPPPAADAEVPAEGLAGLEAVPRPQDKLRPGDPVLVRTSSELDDTPRIRIEARFPQGARGADAFLEAPDGLFLPLPERAGGAVEGTDPNVVVFEAGLGADVDLAALRGKTVTVTLVSETGASVATFPAE